MPYLYVTIKVTLDNGNTIDDTHKILLPKGPGVQDTQITRWGFDKVEVK